MSGRIHARFLLVFSVTFGSLIAAWPVVERPITTALRSTLNPLVGVTFSGFGEVKLEPSGDTPLRDDIEIQLVSMNPKAWEAAYKAHAAPDTFQLPWRLGTMSTRLVAYQPMAMMIAFWAATFAPLGSRGRYFVIGLCWIVALIMLRFGLAIAYFLSVTEAPIRLVLPSWVECSLARSFELIVVNPMGGYLVPVLVWVAVVRPFVGQGRPDSIRQTQLA